MIGNLLKPELTGLIQERNFGKLREVLCEFPPADIAEIFTDLEPADQAVLLRILPGDLATDVFEYLSLEQQETLLLALGNEQVAQILNEMDPDTRTAILEELPAAATQKLLGLLSPTERAVAVRLLGYPEDSIGRRMTPEYVAIKEDWTVARVLEHLREIGQEKESLNQLYVVDKGGKLVGMVRLKNLVTSDLDSPVDILIERQIATLNVLDDQETAVEIFQKYDRTILPVVNSQNILLGVVTVDDVLDVAEEEVTEDMQKMGGMEALEAPYLDIGILSLVQKRVGWLTLLFLGQLLTLTVMGVFHEALAKMRMLVLFLPLLISCGGNSGSQAATLIIRAMSVRDVSLRDWWRVLVRELASGAIFGVVLATLSVIVISVYPFPQDVLKVNPDSSIQTASRPATLNSQPIPDQRVQKQAPPARPSVRTLYIRIAIAVSFSLVGIVLFGCIIGAMLPFLLSLLRFDPAVCSAPLVATLSDVNGLLIYFTIARLVVLKGL